MAIPSGRTWAPGDIPTATHLNTDVRDAVNFFKTPPRITARNTTNLSVPLATWTRLAFDTDVTDTDGFHDPVTNNSRLIVPSGFAGYYYWFITVRWEFHNDFVGARGVQVRKNSGGSVSGGGRMGGDFRHSPHNVLSSERAHRPAQSASGLIQLAVGDYLDSWVWADEDQIFPIADGTTVYHADPSGASGTRFGMIWSRW